MEALLVKSHMVMNTKQRMKNAAWHQQLFYWCLHISIKGSSWQVVFSNDGKMIALRGGEEGVSGEWWINSMRIRFSGFSCKTELTPPGWLHEFIVEDEFWADAIPGIDQILSAL